MRRILCIVFVLAALGFLESSAQAQRFQGRIEDTRTGRSYRLTYRDYDRNDRGGFDLRRAKLVPRDFDNNDRDRDRNNRDRNNRRNRD